jgi:hypothetical protein
MRGEPTPRDWDGTIATLAALALAFTLQPLPLWRWVVVGLAAGAFAFVGIHIGRRIETERNAR